MIVNGENYAVIAAADAIEGMNAFEFFDAIMARIQCKKHEFFIHAPFRIQR